MTKEEKPLKVGVVGCGIIAQTHIGYIRAAGGEVVGVADVSTARGNDFADRHGVQRTYTSVEHLLDVERPDVVHILTPPHTHADAAVAALTRGVHTLVEKPVATDVTDVDRMQKAAEEGGVILTVDHNRLFDPPMLEARRLADEGGLGEVVAVESFQAGGASQRGWLSSLPGGGLGDLIPHPLYLQLAFTGPVSELDAYGPERPDGSPLEELRVLMKGERCSGVLTISMNASPAMNTIKIYGTKMTVEVNLNNMTIVKRREFDLPKILAKPMPNLDEARQLVAQTVSNTIQFVTGKVRYYPGMGELIRRFYVSVREDGPPPVSVTEGREVVRVTSQIWEGVGLPAGKRSMRAVG